MKTRVEIDTWDLLQVAIKELTINFHAGYSYTVKINTAKSTLPWVLEVDDGRGDPVHT